MNGSILGPEFPRRISEEVSQPQVIVRGETIVIESKGKGENGSTWTLTLEPQEALELYHGLREAIGRLRVIL